MFSKDYYDIVAKNHIPYIKPEVVILQEKIIHFEWK